MQNGCTWRWKKRLNQEFRSGINWFGKGGEDGGEVVRGCLNEAIIGSFGGGGVKEV